MTWWMYPVFLYFLLYGSKRNDQVTRICIFGQTLYERLRDPALPAPAATFALGEGGETDDEDAQEEQPAASDDEDAEDERDLWERLDDAGFRLIEEERDLRVGDIGSIVPEEVKKTKCEACKCQMYALSEVYASQLSEGRIGRAYEMKLGAVCENCGRYEPIEISTLSKVGRLPPLLDKHICPNFFDVLEYLERVRGGDAKAAAEGADPALLTKRRDQLEAELNEVRTAIMREKHKNGEGDAYREADRAIGSDD